MNERYTPTQQETTTNPEINATKEILNNIRESTGYQSYEMLANDDGAHRDEFIADKTKNPPLDYPLLRDENKMNEHSSDIKHLLSAIDTIRDNEPESVAEVITPSLGYKAAEMYYVKTLATLNEKVAQKADSEEVAEFADLARELGERLYGRIDQETVDSVHREVWQNIDSKSRTEKAQNIYNELRDGFVWQSNDGSAEYQISGLPRPNEAKPLPTFEDEALYWAGEIVMEDYANIEDCVQTFWNNKVEMNGEDWEANPTEIAEAFEDVLQLIDPEGEAGISIKIDQNGKSLAWSTPEMAVKVGKERASIKSPEVLFQKILHELVIHGGRAIEGLKSDLPILGTGLYTETDPSDYLTFEEGFATVLETAISGKKQKWTPAFLSKYIGLNVAEKGGDFRAAYETEWRYRVLMQLKDDQDPSDEFINKQKRLAYNSCIRIYRGTPTNISEDYPEVKPITFPKDQAYLKGKLLAIDYLKSLHESDDKSSFRDIFKAKYDPTMPKQKEIFNTYSKS